MQADYYISTDKKKLNADLIQDFLSNQSYWAKGRTKEQVEKTIRNSYCIGVYHKDGSQVGFARVLTDNVVFAYVMDVFVIAEHRKKGLGKMLMNFIVNNKEFEGIKRFVLGTQDAHGLYKQYGFTSLSKPMNWMERLKEEADNPEL